MFRWLLFPFSIIYKMIMSFRNFLYDNQLKKAREFHIPVICVGNITVGGTGKTPHVEYLTNILKPHFKIAVLSRGYKRKTKNFVLADIGSSQKEIGDEPKQIKLKYPDVSVAVCENRIKGIDKLIEKPINAELVILDDGYQHRKVKPGFAVLLIDYNRQTVDDYHLPFGNLREGADQSRRANVIIVTKCPDNLKPIDRRVIAKHLNVLPFQTIFFTNLKYDVPISVFNGYQIPKIQKGKTDILLVTGIAQTSSLLEYVHKEYGDKVQHLKFADHQSYGKKAIKKILAKFSEIKNKDKLILTTEKDAVKISEIKDMPEEVQKVLFYIPIQINFLFNDGDIFNKQIIDYVTKDKTNYRLHTTINQF